MLRRSATAAGRCCEPTGPDRCPESLASPASQLGMCGRGHLRFQAALTVSDWLESKPDLPLQLQKPRTNMPFQGWLSIAITISRSAEREGSQAYPKLYVRATCHGKPGHQAQGTAPGARPEGRLRGRRRLGCRPRTSAGAAPRRSPAPAADKNMANCQQNQYSRLKSFRHRIFRTKNLNFDNIRHAKES